MTTKPLRIALTKGRLEKDTVALMERVGLDCQSLHQKGRREYLEARTLPRLLDYLTDHVQADLPRLAQALDISEEEAQSCIDLLLKEEIIVSQENNPDPLYRLKD